MTFPPRTAIKVVDAPAPRLTPEQAHERGVRCCAEFLATNPTAEQLLAFCQGFADAQTADVHS